MKRILFFILGVISFAGVAFAAAPPPPSIPPAQKAAICGKRTTCKITALHKAGSFQVAEVHFGVKDNPDDAPDQGCNTPDGDNTDGGVEYWLLGAKPVQVLALCNDGYGAAGVGEDNVTFGNNRMIHEQEGGSNWRWTNTDTISLSPLRTLNSLGCSYFDMDDKQGDVTYSDYVKFSAVTVAKDPTYHWGDSEEGGCPDTKPAMFAQPKPRYDNKTVGAINVLTPKDGDLDFANLPEGTVPGTCSTTLSTDGSAGFVVFGKPAASNAAVMRVIAPTSHSLLFSIYDPAPSAAPAGKSWISGSHLEVWVLKNPFEGDPLKRTDFDQIAVDLDGTLHAVGNSTVPDVQHWKGADEKGRPVTVIYVNWKPDYGLALGAGAVYSQAEGGKQARLVSTVAMDRGLPLYLPGVAGSDQNRCQTKGGRLDLK